MPSPRPVLGLDVVERIVEAECFRPAGRARVGVELEWLLVSDEDSHVDPLEVRRALGVEDELASGTRLTFEPGGQLELSSPVCADANEVCTLLGEDTAEIATSLSLSGIRIAGMGMDPLRRPRVVVDSPRYRAMERYFDSQGGAGRTMMCNTAAVQVNLDTGTCKNQERRWQLVHAIGPALSAAFAHSPFSEGAPSGYRSTRLSNWADIDATRTAPVLRGGRPAEDWLEYALSARVMLIRRSEFDYVPVTEELTFREWMAAGHELGSPSADDFRYHLTTLFPPVRPQGRLELRFVDALPDPWWKVPVAVISCLLDDPHAAEDARSAAAGSEGMWGQAALHGLDHPRLVDAARDCFDIALGTIEASAGSDDGTPDLVASFVDRYVARGRCPADDQLDEWSRSGSVVAAMSPREHAWT